MQNVIVDKGKFAPANFGCLNRTQYWNIKQETPTKRTEEIPFTENIMVGVFIKITEKT